MSPAGAAKDDHRSAQHERTPMSTAAPVEAPALLRLLQRAAEDGALRRLDVALARSLFELDPAADPRVLLAAALVAHADGQGHVCLPLGLAAGGGLRLQRWLAPAARPLLPGWLAATGWWRATGTSDTHPDPGSAGPLAALRASPLVHVPACRAATPAAPDTAQPARPLVLDGPRLYLHRHWRDEARLAATLRARAATVLSVDEPALQSALAVLFPSAAGVHPATDPQAMACVRALRSRISLVTGGPGTGKTYTAARLLVLAVALEPPAAQLRIALAAPTGKAAARLRQSIATALDAMREQGGPAAAWAATLAARLPPARTLHALLGARPDTRRLRHGPEHPLPADLLLVDEASMVHLDGMARLLDALAPATRLVLLGDKDQLASVEAGAVLADLCADARPDADLDADLDADSDAPFSVGAVPDAELGAEARAGAAAADPPAGARHPSPSPHALACHTTVLWRSRRFDGPIAALARAANAGDAAAARQVLAEGGQGAVQWLSAARRADLLALVLETAAPDLALAAGNTAPEDGYGPMLRALRALPSTPAAAPQDPAPLLALLQAFDRCRVLCAVQEGPWGVKALNAAIELALAQAGGLDLHSPWYPGRPVMVTRNDAAAGVFNGDVGLVLPPAGPGLAPRVAFAEGGSVRLVAASRLPAVQTAYAMTVHKAQGSEFGHTVLVLPPEASPVLTRELVYTGITRARERFTLVTPRAAVLAQALARRSERASGLAERLRAAP
jgi:exodeoxyribonuclease V alpha subunit